MSASESRTYVLLVFGMVALGYLVFLGGTATRSADDFWYSTFFSGTTQDFFALTQKHYMTFNGRALIHMAAQYILYIGNSAFALVVFLLMGTAPLMAEEGERSWGQRLGAMMLFYLGVALLPLEMLRQSLTWISAFCNYALPTVMILLQIMLLFRFAEKGGAVLGLLCVLQSLLCGATTEQSGLIALCVAFFAVFYSFFKGWKRALACFCAALCALGGVATVFASPATQLRATMETEAAEELGESLLWGLETQADYFFDYTALQILFVLLLAGTVVLLIRKGWKRSAGFMGAVTILCGIALLTGYQGAEEGPWIYLACLCALALCALGLWLAGSRKQGAILLCAIASLIVILPTQSNAPRTMFPFAIYGLAVLGQLAGELIPQKGGGWWAYPVLFGLALTILVPQVPIYWKNHQVETLNRTYAAAAKETGVLYHCMDYNIEYSHTKAHVDGYTYRQFLAAEGFSPEDEIYFYGTGLPKVYVNGQRAGSPALKGEGGNWLLPLRDIVEGLGGTVEAGSTIRVLLKETECYLEPYGYQSVRLVARFFTEERKGPWHRGVAERSRNYYCTCVSLQLYTDFLGLEVEFQEDEEAGAFYVTLPEKTEETQNGTA